MEQWRRKAIAGFPELRDELDEAGYTVYGLLIDLRFRFAKTCASRDVADVDRIFQFAAWCLQQDDDLEGAAIACFYEHVFEDCTDWEMVLGYISAEQVATWWTLWELGLGPVEMRRLYKLIGARYGPDAPQPPRRWYLDDFDVDDETLAIRAAWRQANLPQLLLAPLAAYTDGALALNDLLDETAVFLIEMIPYVQPPWLSKAWEIWQEIEAINAATQREERSAPGQLTPLERADVGRLVVGLRRLVDGDDASALGPIVHGR